MGKYICAIDQGTTGTTVIIIDGELEVHARVNQEFRTLTGPENTAVMGSSMGGLLSFYLVTYHPETFGACGCESTHFPLSEAVVASKSDAV